MVSVFIWFEPWSNQTKNYKIVICCLSAKHTALIIRSKSKDWLALNHNNVSEQHVYLNSVVSVYIVSINQIQAYISSLIAIEQT